MSETDSGQGYQDVTRGGGVFFLERVVFGSWDSNITLPLP